MKKKNKEQIIIKENAKKELATTYKIAASEVRSNFLFLSLFGVAFVFLFTGMSLFNGALQNLFLGLGTGFFTSAIVSLVFYLNDKEIKKRQRLMARKGFMDDFKILFHNIIYCIDFTALISETITLEEYIKNQHRWFHEYYKQMVANNPDKDETKKRVDYLKAFLSKTQALFQQCFEYNSSWKEGEYNTWQKKELIGFYLDYKNTQICIQNEDYKQAFLEFSCCLETFKRMSNEFEELKNFNLLFFSYDKEGKSAIQKEKFEEKELMFKFAREFNEIRENNYKKYYAKDINGRNQ